MALEGGGIMVAFESTEGRGLCVTMPNFLELVSNQRAKDKLSPHFFISHDVT